MTRPTVCWFRRDLRLDDHPALAAAARTGGPVLALYVLDPALLGPAGPPRRRFLAAALGALQELTGAQVAVVSGDPAQVVPAVAAAVDAPAVFATADFGPYGRRRDEVVAAALAADGRRLETVDTPYAVAPGTLRTGGGTPFQVFTPFHKAWQAHGWDAPTSTPAVTWLAPDAAGRPLADPASIAADSADRGGAGGGEPHWTPGTAGPEAALDQLDAFLAGPVQGYKDHRDVPAEPGTSRLSVHLRWGTIHPRQILARLGPEPGPQAFARQLAWREFYADVLFARPETARLAYQPKMAAMELDEGPVADGRFEAWAQGRTGYPIVDAGMRELAATGWMHNRVRLITASFLVKDLHIDWTRGARWFMRHLVDGDLANNNHGWQWVAGTGTDAAPYFRIFNPMSQAQRFDPDGRYVRRWVPELAGVADRYVHHPWDDPKGMPLGYPYPVVEHDAERKEALRRYEAITTATRA